MFNKMYKTFHEMSGRGLSMTNGFKSAFAIQTINAFVFGTISILLPLLMIDRGISVESMGLIFAVLPVISQTTRLLFGCVSDYIGRKKFYLANGLMNIAYLASYYLASTPIGFLIGKIFEGVKDASLWSVNRAYFMDHTDHDHEKEKILIKVRGTNAVFEALGMISAGFLVALLLYNNTLLLLIGLSVLLFPNVLMLKDKVKQNLSLNLRAIIKSLDFRHKSKKFKNFVTIFFLLGLSWGFISGYILPLFLTTIGISVEVVGLLLGVRVLFNGLFVYVFSSVWVSKRKILVGGLAFSLLLAMMAFSNYTILPFIVIFMGMFSGMADAGYETIFVTITDHTSLGRDIGILMIGVHVGMSITQALSGFVITSFGFPILFFTSGMLFALFSLASYYNLNSS